MLAAGNYHFHLCPLINLNDQENMLSHSFTELDPLYPRKNVNSNFTSRLYYSFALSTHV